MKIQIRPRCVDSHLFGVLLNFHEFKRSHVTLNSCLQLVSRSGWGGVRMWRNWSTRSCCARRIIDEGLRCFIMDEYCCCNRPKEKRGRLVGGNKVERGNSERMRKREILAVNDESTPRWSCEGRLCLLLLASSIPIRSRPSRRNLARRISRVRRRGKKQKPS